MTTTEQATQSPPILTATLAALLIQQAAAEAGLPLPFEVAARRSGEVSLHFHLDELTAWAVWLEATIGRRRVDGRGHVHHVATVEWLDWPFRLVAVTVAEVAA